MTHPDYVFTLPNDEPNAPIAAGSYVVSRQNAAELIAMTWDGYVRNITHDHACAYLHSSFDPLQDWNNRTVFFARAGGFGDLMAMTPAIHEIKSRWPQSIIKVATHKRHAPILENNEDINEILDWPVSLDEWTYAGAHVWLDQSIERQKNANTTHFVDLVAQECGNMPISDKRMRYTVAPNEAALAHTKYPRNAKYTARIGVQVHSNAANRTYPIAKLHEALMHLHKKKWEIFLFGDDAALRNAVAPGVTIIGTSSTSIRASAAILTTCDVVLAPDSSLCHLAGALGLPTVALYGPFPWQLRTAYNPSVRAIQGKAKCAPCFHHVARGQHFCKACPTARQGFCAAMDSIEPKRIVKMVEEAVKP
jgi:ADP-heptose:LPS heptosyltransferase